MDTTGLAPGKIQDASIRAGKNLGEILVVDQVDTAAITAAGGYMGDIHATNRLADSQVRAWFGIGTVQADVIDDTAIHSNRKFIEAVTAHDGVLSGVLRAETDIGPVWSEQAMEADVTAQTILSVTSDDAEISGFLHAYHTIGNVTASTDIRGAITAGEADSGVGNIGRVLAGADTQGDIHKHVKAGRNIYFVKADAHVDDSGYALFEQGVQAVYQALLAMWLDDPDADPASIPGPPQALEPPVGAAGTVHSMVTAGRHIGGVSADQDIREAVDAGERLYLVGARGNIEKDVSSGLGAMTLHAGREMKGDLTAHGHIFASSYGDMSSNAASDHGVVVLDSWSAITSQEISGPAGVHVAAHDSITSSTINSTNGVVSLGSRGNVHTQAVDASQAVAAGTLGTFKGQVISQHGDVVANAVRGIDAQINAHQQAVAATLGDIEGSIIADGVQAEVYDSLKADVTANDSVRLYVRNEVTGNVTSGIGDIYLNAGTINGSNITASDGVVGLDVFGNMNGQVQGTRGVAASVLGSVGSSISSSDGGVLILSDGDVAGTVTAGDDKIGIGIVSWGDVSASLTAQNGPVSVTFSYGNVSGEITAGKDAHANTWGSVTGLVGAGGDAVIVARHNVNQNVTAGRDVRITAGGTVAGTTNGARDAVVYANVDITGDVTGARDAKADALGGVNADVTATSRDAVVSALGDYTGNVEGGRHATLAVGGSIANTTVNAGNTAQMSAHGPISQTQVTANDDALILGDTDVDSSEFQSNGASVVLTALDGISEVDVQAAVDAQIFAGANANLNVAAINRNIDLVTLGNLEGSFTAGNDASISAYGAIGGGEDSVSIAATGGDASIFGKSGVTATVTGQSITSSALMDISGTYTATGGEISIYTGTGFDGTASAFHSVAVTAQEGIDGEVTSQYRNAWAYVWGDGPAPPPPPPPDPPDPPPPPPPPPPGNVSADVQAFVNAQVTALSGGVTGKVTATQGNAAVTARTELTSQVTAGRDARIWVVGPVSGDDGISAGRDAYVTSYANISTGVTATGADAFVSAGTNLSADVTGERNAWAEARTADLTGNVTSHVDDASAVAGGKVSGDVTGQRHAMAAALGNVDGNVEAIDGHASAVAHGGQVTGMVTAAQSAGAFALGSITGNVYAGRDAISVTLDSSLGSVTAGRDALAVAGDAASGPVAGGRHAGVLAFGTVSSSVTAASGDAFVATWGTVDNTVSAGDSAFVAAGDGGTVTMNAPNDVTLVSFGTVTASMNAGRDAYAWSAGNLLGNLQAARDGVVISLASAAIGVETGRDAYVWAFDEYHNNVFSGRDALIVSLGDVNAGVFASGSGLIYAVEDVIGSVEAGEYAGVVTWGDAAGPMTVRGPDGAFGWAYGDFNGFVESTDGNAFLTAYGNGLGAVRGGMYAEAYTVGDWLGDIEAGDVAAGIALGVFNGNVTAASDGYVLSEGSVDAGLTAGRDVYVWAIGGVEGNYTAGRDATVITYADYDADLYAARDVGRREFNGYALPGVWARGDITGTIEAGRNIGNDQHTGAYTEWDYGVFSYGSINATIKAENTAGHSDGGHIQSVAAWGPIAGHIEAGDTTHYIRSGDAVTATLIAPNLPTPVEFDSTITTDHPYPATPDSIVGQVMAEVADDYALVSATKTQVANDIAQLLVDFAADKAADAVALADTIAEVSASVADAITEAADALAADIAAGNAELDAAKDAAAAQLVAFQAEINATEAAIQVERNLAIAEQDAAYSEAVTLAATIAGNMPQMDANIADMRSSALDQSADKKAQWEQDWYAKRAEIVVAGGGNANDVNDWAVHCDATWEQAKHYPVEVGEYLYGYFIKGPWGMIKGTYSLIRHPIKSAKGLYYAVRHPVESFGAIKKDVVDQWNSGNAGRGAVLFDAAMTILPAAKASQTSKVRVVAKSQRIAHKIEDAAPGGARGPVSGREFNPAEAGGAIRQLTTENIKITNKGIDVVEQHLARFGPDAPNQVMVQRLRDIAAGKIKPTQADLNFYSHELREFVRYRRQGRPHGAGDDYSLWNNAHTATLEDYGIPGMLEDLYHPDAIRQLGN